jgi:hypothetical protein
MLARVEQRDDLGDAQFVKVDAWSSRLAAVRRP